MSLPTLPDLGPMPNAMPRTGVLDSRALAANDALAPSKPAPLASAIYRGWVRHRRYAPHANAFRYRMYMLYVDLAEIDTLFARRWLWSVEQRNVAEFRRRDFLGDAAVPLDSAVRNLVARETGIRPSGPIRLLTHLRYFGLSFNPVSFYYCYADDGSTLENIVADITNTPWKERHAYVLPVAEAQRHGGALRWAFDKQFHVSPFLPLHCRYDWRFSVPGESVRVHMDVYKSTSAEHDNYARELDATLVLERRELNAGNLARVLARHPLMTLKIVAAIHWQALKIFLRGNPIFDHPGKSSASSESSP